MDAEHLKKGGTPDYVVYKGKDYIEGKQEAYLEKKYLNKKCETEHGVGYVCGFDLPRSRAWRFMIKITDNTKKPILKSLFPDNILGYWVKEVKFL